MKNYSRSFKKKTLMFTVFMSAFAIIGTMISSFAFGQKGINDTANTESLISIYVDTKYEYTAKNLTPTQLNQLADHESTKEFAPYYMALASIDTPKGSLDISVRSLKDEQQIELTEYTNSRIVSKTSLTGNDAFITEKLSKTYSMPLGYKIRVAGEDFSITRIYRDTADLATIYIPNFASLVSEKFGTDISYNGLYLTTKNKEQTVYYSSSIGVVLQDKMDGYENKKKESDGMYASAKNNFVLFGVLSGSVYLFGTILYLLITFKTTSKEIVDSGRKETITRTNLTHIIGLFVECVSLITSLLILKTTCMLFVKLSSVFSSALLGLIIALIFVLVSYLVNIIWMTLLKREKQV